MSDDPFDPMSPYDPFTGKRMALSKCCHARIISHTFMDKTWPACGKCHNRTSPKELRQPHYCPYCPLCYYSKGALTQHINREHPEEAKDVG